MSVLAFIYGVWANITNDGENNAEVIVFISYFGFLIAGAITLFYMHSNGHIDLANMYGRPRDELIQEELERLERRREKEKTAWERSKRKGDLGYYSAHRTGGYKDGLNDGEFSMKGPKKFDENRARTIRNRGGKNPSLHSAKIPEKAGTRLLKYTWEDDVCVVRIFVEHIPGCKSWAEADISSKGISVRWEDRESVLLLLHNSKKENFFLHIPELYKDVEDVRTFWKKNKCIIKITKRVYEEWPTLDKKERELPTVEDSQRQAYEERQRKEAENKTK